MSKKSQDTKRHRGQVDKTLRNLSKPNFNTGASVLKNKVTAAPNPSLRDQYDVIKKDLLKLRDDLARGYDMAKNLVEKKGLVKELLNTK